MKQKIWERPRHLQPQNLNQLKAAITNAANNLDPQMISSAFAGMVDRVNKCITKKDEKTGYQIRQENTVL